jgi:hypothetical protein
VLRIVCCISLVTIGNNTSLPHSWLIHWCPALLWPVMNTHTYGYIIVVVRLYCTTFDIFFLSLYYILVFAVATTMSSPRIISNTKTQNRPLRERLTKCWTP